MLTVDSLTLINNDGYGNPRYVFHFLNVADNYGEAVYIAKKLIGKWSQIQYKIIWRWHCVFIV